MATRRRHGGNRFEHLESRVLLSSARLIVDANDSPLNQRFQDHVSLGTRMLFTAETREFGRELWTSNGTPNGTKLLKDIAPGFTSSDVKIWDTRDGIVYFSAFDGEAYGIWQSNGTRPGTSRLAFLDSPRRPIDVEIVGSQLYVSSSGLHAIDLTTGEKSLVVREAITFKVTDSGIFFVSAGARYARQSLWVLRDQTRTELISDMLLGPMHESSGGVMIETFGDIGVHGTANNADREVWRSNGTVAGTYHTEATFPSATEVSVAYSDDNGTYFNVFTDDSYALHFGDGSPENTRQLQGDSPFYPHWFVEHEERLLVDHDGLRELDPATGTFDPIADGQLFASGPGGHYLRDADDLVFFDGTTTTNLGPIPVAFDRPVGAVLNTGTLVANNEWGPDLILFEADREPATIATIATGRTASGSMSANWHAMFSDGYLLGTGQRIDEHGVVHDDNLPVGNIIELSKNRLVFDFGHVYSVNADWSYEELHSGSSISNSLRLGDHAFFVSSNANGESELWKTDGTREGTAKAVDRPLGPTNGCYHSEVAAFEEKLLFYSSESTCGGNGETTLWVTNGRAGKATKLLDVRRRWPDHLDGGLSSGTALNGRFIFTTETDDDGRVLFSSDGTPKGTRKISVDVLPRRGFEKLGNYVYFIGTSLDGFRGVYRTDGTTAELVHRPDRGYPVSLQRQNGRLFVSSLETDEYENTYTWTLRASDGGDFEQIASNASGRIYSIRGLSLFRTGDGTWITDGTAEGTRKIVDTGQSHYAEVGEKIFFIANDQLAGAEPHELFLDPAVAFRQSDLLYHPRNR